MRRLSPLLVVAASCTLDRAPSPAPTWSPLLGSHIGFPAKYSAGLGVARVVQRHFSPTNRVAHSDRDVFALIEPGVRAGRVSLGYGVERDDSRATTLVNVRATALRRWSSGPNRNYLGIELSAQTLEEGSLGARVGVFEQVAGPAVRHQLLYSIDFPVGW